MDNEHYATNHEFTFLDNLGRWADIKVTKAARIDLLKRYQKALRRRDEWEHINRVRVERHLISLIEREELLAA